jgi:hypothetical protein
MRAFVKIGRQQSIITEDVEVFAAISESGQNVAVDLAAVKVLGVDEDDAVDWIHVADVIDKVTSAQVDCDLSIG